MNATALCATLLGISLITIIISIIMSLYIFYKKEYYMWQLITAIMTFVASIVSICFYATQSMIAQVDGVLLLMSVCGAIIIAFVLIPMIVIYVFLEIKWAIKQIIIKIKRRRPKKVIRLKLE